MLGAVKVGDEITYEISYKNYKNAAAIVTIEDTLDEHVEYVSSEPEGTLSGGVVTWKLTGEDGLGIPAGEAGVVKLTVKVLKSALVSEDGPGKVVNGGPGATVQVGNDNKFELDVVENPVPEEPEKKETKPYEGNGVLGAVKVGDKITYEISYQNYKTAAADVVIKDKLDPNARFVSASNGGVNNGGTVTWTLASVPAGQKGTVTLTIEVLPGAMVANGGTGSVVNGGDTATVKVGNDHEFTLNTVENPVPEEPHKREISPYAGTGVLGAVKVGDRITYEITYRNYKTEAADIVIRDKLDPNVEFVSASDSGSNNGGTVIWTLRNVPAGRAGRVTLTVRVLKGALVSEGGSGRVVNGGDTATVKVGNDNEFTLEVVQNPVPEEPENPDNPGNKTVSVTVQKIWNDNNNAEGLRPARIRVTLSTGTSYILSEANGWTVTVHNLPAERNGTAIQYTWSEQRVIGYTQETRRYGNTTVFVNTYTPVPLPKLPGRKGTGKIVLLDDYDTPLGVQVEINHVGDCYE